MFSAWLPSAVSSWVNERFNPGRRRQFPLGFLRNWLAERRTARARRAAMSATFAWAIRPVIPGGRVAKKRSKITGWRPTAPPMSASCENPPRRARTAPIRADSTPASDRMATAVASPASDCQRGDERDRRRQHQPAAAGQGVDDGGRCDSNRRGHRLGRLQGWPRRSRSCSGGRCTESSSCRGRAGAPGR